MASKSPFGNGMGAVGAEGAKPNDFIKDPAGSPPGEPGHDFID